MFDLTYNKCPDCGVYPGSMHEPGCEIERCPECGRQLLICGCTYQFPGTWKIPRGVPWSGEYPGVAECREFKWYCKLVEGQGWVSCDKDAPGASEDLNRLYREATWDSDTQRFIRWKAERGN